jgi:PKHD-type hydroxylase
MQLKNWYYFFKSALTPEECKKIINTGLKQIDDDKSKGVNTAAETFGKTHKQALLEKNNRVNSINDKTLEELSKETGKSTKEIAETSYIRDSEVSWLENDWIYNLINPYIKKANKDSGWMYDLDCSEMFQFTVYKPGGFYGWHYDGSSDHFSVYKRAIPGVTPDNHQHTKNNNHIGKVRKLSLTINLNAPGEYDGGNLKFDFGPHYPGKRFHECEEIRPQGSIILFPSFLYHQVTPITRGTRYSLVLWVLGKPFR